MGSVGWYRGSASTTSALTPVLGSRLLALSRGEKATAVERDVTVTFESELTLSSTVGISRSISIHSMTSHSGLVQSRCSRTGVKTQTL
jgi:hypothetical protein